jgi:TetR/AcrR family transcriptional regulator
MPNAPASRERERNADRTRTLILRAAERLFADRGFERTSLSQVGEAAGVSRATPGYFFGSKAELYRAVIERSFEEVRDAVRRGRERALESGQAPEVVLAGAVSDYVDFIAARPYFVKLIERDALSDQPVLDAMPLGIAVGRDMVDALTQELALVDVDPDDVAHLLFSLLALTWFPHIHGQALSRVIGLDAENPAFLAARKRHVTELFLGWLRARQTADRP